MEKENLKSYLLAYARKELNHYSNYNFECPCCKKPRSFSIDQKQGFKKFKCFNKECELNNKTKNKNYDIFDLVEIITGLADFKDKLSYLEEYIQKNDLKPIEAKITIPTSRNKPSLKASQEEENSIPEVEECSSVMKEWFNQRNEDLMSNEAIMNQLRFRGFQDDFIKEMNFGYLPPVQNKNYGEIIIPFIKSSHFIKWNYNHDKNKQSKYIETGNKEIFNCGIIGRSERPIFVCEGIFDTMALLQEGFESVCLCSADSVDLFIRYIKKHKPTSNLIILLDNDEVGIRASNDLIGKLWEEKIIFLKNQTLIPNIAKLYKKPFKDINEIYSYSEKSKRTLIKYLNNSEELASKEFERLYSKMLRLNKTK